MTVALLFLMCFATSLGVNMCRLTVFHYTANVPPDRPGQCEVLCYPLVNLFVLELCPKVGDGLKRAAYHGSV